MYNPDTPNQFNEGKAGGWKAGGGFGGRSEPKYLSAIDQWDQAIKVIDAHQQQQQVAQEQGLATSSSIVGGGGRSNPQTAEEDSVALYGGIGLTGRAVAPHQLMTEVSVGSSTVSSRVVNIMQRMYMEAGQESAMAIESHHNTGTELGAESGPSGENGAISASSGFTMPARAAPPQLGASLQLAPSTLPGWGGHSIVENHPWRGTPSTVLRLGNVATSAHLGDQDFLGELVQGCESYGGKRAKVEAAFVHCPGEATNSVSNHEQTLPQTNRPAFVFVKFTTVLAARSAADVLPSQIFDGARFDVAFYPVDRYHSRNLDDSVL